MSTKTSQLLFDRCRTAMYAIALVVSIGSLWTVAWANSLDEPSSTGACALAPLAVVHHAAVASGDAGCPGSTADH